MFHSSVYADRRRRLQAQVNGPVLLLGNGERSSNLPMNKLPFRQDSTFWYFTGCKTPHAAMLLDDQGCTLFLPEPTEDDPLWHGEVPSFAELKTVFGVDAIRPITSLWATVAGRAVSTLAVGDEAINRDTTAHTGVPLAFGKAYGSPELVDAVIALRRPKDSLELSEMRKAAAITVRAHRAAMRATTPGSSEQALTALFEGFLASRGCGTGYGTILTQRGEILHTRDHDAILEAGRLLLLDGGGELWSTGYGADLTRTWPVSGRFDPRQKAAYAAVLEANKLAIAQCRPGVRYRDIHDVACRVIAQFMKDEGILRGDVDSAVEQGAHAVFFPHGVGHHLGMDVHDLENFGDLPSYARGAKRSDLFGTAYLRMDLPLEAGWIVTIEPGFYAVPAIFRDQRLRDRLSGVIDFGRAEHWIGLGGIRIEDDVVITSGDPEVLSAGLEKEVSQLEALIGTGPTAEQRFAE